MNKNYWTVIVLSVFVVVSLSSYDSMNSTGSTKSEQKTIFVTANCYDTADRYVGAYLFLEAMEIARQENLVVISDTVLALLKQSNSLEHPVDLLNNAALMTAVQNSAKVSTSWTINYLSSCWNRFDTDVKNIIEIRKKNIPFLFNLGGNEQKNTREKIGTAIEHSTDTLVKLVSNFLRRPLEPSSTDNTIKPDQQDNSMLWLCVLSALCISLTSLLIIFKKYKEKDKNNKYVTDAELMKLFDSLNKKIEDLTVRINSSETNLVDRIEKIEGIAGLVKNKSGMAGVEKNSESVKIVRIEMEIETIKAELAGIKKAGNGSGESPTWPRESSTQIIPLAEVGKSLTSSLNPSRVFYMGHPANGERFSKNSLSDTQVEGIYYKAGVYSSENEAEFEFVSSEETIDTLRANNLDKIRNGFEFATAVPPNVRRVITDSPGKIVREDDGSWKIVRKAVIRFEQ